MSKSGQESLRLIIGAFEVGGSQSSIPIASSYKKTEFQMSNKNAGFFFFFSYTMWWCFFEFLS